jgi:hypothetical protein
MRNIKTKMHDSRPYDKFETVSRYLASRFQAWLNCQKSGNDEWLYQHKANIEDFMRNHAPSGSGVDSGTTFDFDASKPGKLVFNFSYHHMNDGGYYDGWTDHQLIVKPSFTGLDLRITGKDRNQTKEYLHDVYSTWLSSRVETILEDADFANDCACAYCTRTIQNY